MGLKTALAARARFAPIVVASAVLSSAVLGLSATGTLSAFTASITNQDSVSTAGLVMKEALTGGSSVCLSSDASAGSCTINKYGTDLLTPAHPQNVTTVTFTNTGSSPITSFTMTPASCSKAASGANAGATTGSANPCTGITLGVTCVVGSGTPVEVVASGTTLAAFGTGTALPITGCTPVASSGTPATFTFTVRLANTDDSMQNVTANQALTWRFQNGTS